MASSFSGEIVKSPELDVPVIRMQYEAPTPERNLLVEMAPHFGSNLYRYRVGGNEIIYSDPEVLKQRDWTGTFVLWPIPNRVKDKQYEFEGHVQPLTDIRRPRGNEPLIHGLVDDLEWNFDEPEVTNKQVSAKTWIEINPGSPAYKYYPYPSTLVLDYTLTAAGINVDYTVFNNGDKNMPFGFALHPSFALLSGPDKTMVTLPAEHIMEADAELLPSGELKPMGSDGYDLRRPTAVGELALDHVFTGLHEQTDASIEYPEQGLKLLLKASRDFTHMVLYTLETDEGFIVFENQTGSTDMINLHTRAQKEKNKELANTAHLMVLPPGQAHQGNINYGVQFLAGHASS